MTLKDLRPALRNFLLADTAISTAVGGTRVHGVRLPAGVIAGPSIVFTPISETTDYHMQGSSGLITARYQLDAWAETMDLAESLALLVKLRMEGFSGEMEYGSNSPRDTIAVRAIFATNGFAEFDSEAVLYRSSRDYSIHYGDR